MRAARQNKNSDSPVCYVCGNPGGRYCRRVNEDYSVIKCSECGLEYTDPIPAETTLKAFYASYSDIRADKSIVKLNAQEHLKILKNRYGWTQESAMLDFGSGGGTFVELAGENCYGVEYQSSANIRIKTILNELPIRRWDFITLWGVLEHLPHPKKVIDELVSLLRNGGIMVLTTVDAEGVIPYYYKPPEHLSYWTRVAFCELAQRCGLKIIDYEPYWMFQLGDIYRQRLLSRTPVEYRESLSSGGIPPVVYVPTNEVRVIMKKLRRKNEF